MNVGGCPRMCTCRSCPVLAFVPTLEVKGPASSCSAAVYRNTLKVESTLSSKMCCWLRKAQQDTMLPATWPL